MRFSTVEAFAPSRKLTNMSTQGPSNPAGDRPRMAEALASLKEGLRDTADPLYDGWKLRPRAPASPHPQIPAPEAAPRPASTARDAAIAPPADAGETIEITLEGTPDGTPVSSGEPAMSGGESDGEPETPRLDAWFDQGLATQDELIEVLHEEAAPAADRRPSVQTDTVRVRIIRYQHFPRWALIAAAALLVFAVSVLVLRVSFPRQSAGSTHVGLAAETASLLPTAERARFASGSVAIAPSVAVPPRSGSRSSPASEATPLAAAAELVPLSQVSSSSGQPSAGGSASPAAVKMPASSPKRRPGGHDFFRDPGF